MEEAIQPEAISIKSLQTRFPNLVDRATCSDIHNEEEIIKECEGLLTIAEMFDLKDKVFEIGIHGSVPVMYLIVGVKEGGGYVLEKLYNHKSPYFDKFEFENWDSHDYPDYKKIADFLDNPEGFKTFKSGNWIMSMDLRNETNKNPTKNS